MSNRSTSHPVGRIDFPPVAELTLGFSNYHCEDQTFLIDDVSVDTNLGAMVELLGPSVDGEVVVNNTLRFHWNPQGDKKFFSFQLASSAEFVGEFRLGEVAFSNSMFTCFAFESERLVGAGRILADGVDCAYVCDMAVHPTQQGKGVGKAILTDLVNRSRGHGKIILYAVPVSPPSIGWQIAAIDAVARNGRAGVPRTSRISNDFRTVRNLRRCALPNALSELPFSVSVVNTDARNDRMLACAGRCDRRVQQNRIAWFQENLHE